MRININWMHLLVWGILCLGLAVRVSGISAPITYQEASESYNSYSVLKTGKDTNNQFLPIIFKGEENYPSTSAVYIRIPFIWLFGLNEYGVRLSSILIGQLSIYIAYLNIKKLLKNLPVKQNKYQFFSLLFLIGLTFSPWLIKIHLFNLSITLVFFLCSLLLWLLPKLHHPLFYLTLIFLGLTSFTLIPGLIFLILILVFSQRGKSFLWQRRLLLLLTLIAITLPVMLDAGYKNYLISNSVINNMLPKNFLWEVDRRLAYDLVEQSPLNTKEFNFNRLIHNKVFYPINNFFIYTTEVLDINKTISPLQAGLRTETAYINEILLPKFLYLEIPLIVLGLIALIRKSFDKHISRYIGWIAGGLILVWWNKSLGFDYLAPLLILCEVIGLMMLLHLLQKIKQQKFLNKRLIIAVIIFFWILNYAIFINILAFHQRLWVGQDDLRQQQVWSYIKGSMDNYQQIIVSDLFGEPVNYYLYYNNYDPAQYHDLRELGGLNVGNIRQINKVGEVYFRSFKYLESDRKPGQLWVGFSSEFVGRLMGYKDVETISDGNILKKIKEVIPKDQFLGDEIWFVETQF